MAVQINKSKCDSCYGAKEPLCVFICPGDLFYFAEGGSVKIRDSRDCWDCAACLKSCPKQAIEMYTPVQMGGQGALLIAQTKGKEIYWRCIWPNGQEENFKEIVKL